MVFRNDPCPCGCGKKYKKCCLKKAKKAAEQETPRHALGVPTSQLAEIGVFLEIDAVEELDRVSNSVLDMIKEKNFDDALNTCARLLDEWPDFSDGLERSARVHEAMADFEKARDFYARTIAFTEQHDGFEDGGLADMCRKRIAVINIRLSGGG